MANTDKINAMEVFEPRMPVGVWETGNQENRTVKDVVLGEVKDG